jgi:oligosaccharide repeat unit polymerase
MLSDLSGTEILLLLALCASIATVLGRAYFHADKAELWSPMSMISVVYIYYCVVGTIMAVIDNGFIFRLTDHREFLDSALLGALLSFCATWFGFSVYSNIKIKPLQPVKNYALLSSDARFVFFWAVFLLVLFVGPNFIYKINFMERQTDVDYSGVGGSFSGYLMQSLIFFASASLLAFVPLLKGKHAFWFILIFAFSASLFITGGFRYRLVILCYSLISVYHLAMGIRINWKLIVSFLFPFLLLMGAMEIARSYGRGLDTDRLAGLETKDLLSNSTTESAVFLASGFVIDEYSNHFKHSHFDFFINAIAAPIPRAMWPNKPDGSYMLKVIPALYSGNLGTGQAFLHYAEYYMAFGWYGVVIIPFILGMIMKRFWLWYKANRTNEYAIVLISLANSALYVLVSRGYFSQFLTLFCFTCLPAYYVYRRYYKKYNS